METMADRVRAALQALSRSGEEITTQTVINYMGLKTKKDKKPVYKTMNNLRIQGEIVHIAGTRTYQYFSVKKPLLRTVMWRILRARKKATVEDLMELAGASGSYAKEWLKMLEKRGVVKEMKGGCYRMVEDPVEEPVDFERIGRLRRWRKGRKKALAALDQAAASIDVAKRVLRDCE